MISTHEHLLVRPLIARPPVNVEQVIAWTSEVVDMLCLKFLHAPVGAYCDDKGNKGVTVVAILNSSHLAVHVWDEPDPALLQLDVYSCRKLDIQKVLTHLNVFSIVKIKHRLFDRSVAIRELFPEQEEKFGIAVTGDTIGGSKLG
jgi:S-adenosylmethionine/arginine decarboxylase-like enzyme